MNVIHIAETVKGGVATVINNLTENNEIDSHVICPESQSKEIYCAQKTLFSRTGRNISSLSSLFLVIIKTLKYNKFDVIHLHSSFAGFIVRALFAFKLINKKKYKVIYTPHCFSFIMDTKKWKKKAYIYIERILAKQTDCIIANS
ncbi:glycosyltransferase, partial [Klebsiella pneumoniae]|nr:glycosyltransferase [Klebsiella pneumoniae]